MSTTEAKSATAINWKDVDVLIKNGQAKLTALAKSYDVSTSQLRVEMLGHYGNRITFVRGRNGGIRFANTNPKGE